MAQVPAPYVAGQRHSFMVSGERFEVDAVRRCVRARARVCLCLCLCLCLPACLSVKGEGVRVQRYTPISPLGSGAFGVVCACHDR